MIYLKKFDYHNISRGERKKAETANGRSLLRTAVLNEFEINTDKLTIVTAEHGKPYFSERQDIFFNISHSGDYVAAAVGKSEIGVDVQIVRSVKDNLIQKLCNNNEKEFIQSAVDKNKAFITLWALKESYIKAIGMGMSFPMSEINFNLRDFNGELEGSFSNQTGRFYVRDCGEFVLAACALGEDTLRTNFDAGGKVTYTRKH